MERRLEIIEAIKDAIVIGTKNSASLVGAVILYVLTIWIPYLNVGTTIAMNTIPGKLAKGEVINPMFIFDEVYRRRMGSFFLLEGLILIVMIPAFLFMVIPGYVIALSYSLALYIMLDKDVSPTDALELSTKATNGFKWKIFFLNIVFAIVIGFAFGIIMGIVGAIDVDVLTAIVGICFVVIAISCEYALNAVIYRNLFLDEQEEDNETEIATEE